MNTTPSSPLPIQKIDSLRINHLDRKTFETFIRNSANGSHRFAIDIYLSESMEIRLIVPITMPPSLELALITLMSSMKRGAWVTPTPPNLTLTRLDMCVDTSSKSLPEWMTQDWKTSLPELGVILSSNGKVSEHTTDPAESENQPAKSSQTRSSQNKEPGSST